MKKNFFFIKNKKASVTTITLFAIMCILFPMLAIIYDIGMIHIYKQDLKNIQELSGTTCTPTAEEKVNMPASCKQLARSYVLANLGENEKFSKIEGIKSQIRELRNTKYGLPPCDSDEVTKTRLCKESGFDVVVHPEGNRMIVNIVGIGYKPMFLTKHLLSFGNTKTPKELKNYYPLKIPASKFSPTYQKD